MFIIIGSDGKEYGPVTTEQVRHWITSGRANLSTKAKPVGSTEWRELGDFAEFGDPSGLPPMMGATNANATSPSVPVTEDASRGARIGAALLNALIYFLSTIPGSMITSVQLLKQNPELAKGGFNFARMAEMDVTGINTTWTLVGFLVVVLVQLLLIAFRGQNLGKLMVGVRVVQVDNGQRAGFMQAGVLRFLLPTSLLFLPYGWAWLGVLFLLVDLCFIFREDGRCLHDLIAGTKVVKT